MPRVSTAFKEDRRAEILEAARRCVARSGFHQASMQDICAEAGMSPGNLYRYFPSKEAIIAGIAERDRAEVGAQLAAGQFTEDFFASFAALARHHFVERTADEVGLCAEIMSESRRNPGDRPHHAGLRRRRANPVDRHAACRCRARRHPLRRGF